jgi:hypothetical protein
MIDAFHASELIYLRIYRALFAARADVLAPYSDAAALARRAHAPAGALDVFGPITREAFSVGAAVGGGASMTSSDAMQLSTGASSRRVTR